MQIQSQAPNGEYFGWDDAADVPPDHRRLTEDEIEARRNEQSAPSIPFAITRRQARLALLQAGKLAAVDSAIAAISDPTERMAAQIEYEAETWERGNQWLVKLGDQIGLDAEQIDDLFVVAAKL